MPPRIFPGGGMPPAIVSPGFSRPRFHLPAAFFCGLSRLRFDYTPAPEKTKMPDQSLPASHPPQKKAGPSRPGICERPSGPDEAKRHTARNRRTRLLQKR